MALQCVREGACVTKDEKERGGPGKGVEGHCRDMYTFWTAFPWKQWLDCMRDPDKVSAIGDFIFLPCVDNLYILSRRILYGTAASAHITEACYIDLENFNELVVYFRKKVKLLYTE